jgi:hypothetical protein
MKAHDIDHHGYDQNNAVQSPPGEAEGSPVKEIRTRKTRMGNAGAPTTNGVKVLSDNSARAKLLLWNDSAAATVLVSFSETGTISLTNPRQASMSLAPGATFTIDNYAGEVHAVYTTAPAANEDLRYTEFLT